jgi:hypothetical protein
MLNLSQFSFIRIKRSPKVSRKNLKDTIPQYNRHAKEHVRQNSFNYLKTESFGLQRRLIGRSAARLSLAMAHLREDQILPKPIDVKTANHKVILLPLDFIGRQASHGIVSYNNVRRARHYFEEQSGNRQGPVDFEITQTALRWNKRLYLIVDSQELEEERQKDVEILSKRYGFKELPRKITGKPLCLEIAACHKSAKFDYPAIDLTKTQVLQLVDEIQPINESVMLGGLDVYPDQELLAA